MNKFLTAIGLMSGTSLDGIDVALIVTDGNSVKKVGPYFAYSYDNKTKERIKNAIKGKVDKDIVGKELTEIHAKVVNDFLSENDLRKQNIDLIGFHGQTIAHKPENGITVQIGDGKLLAELTGISVVNDFRTNDVKHRGQGAPLVPAYHAAIAKNFEHPIAIVNIGGVGNVTWIGSADEILAFDTGPGNAMIDDWVFKHNGDACDKDGKLAASGKVNKKVLKQLLSAPYFAAKPPKSLDRNDFVGNVYEGLSLEDGTATLSMFTVLSIKESIKHFREKPKVWYITGGGRHNSYIMKKLKEELKAPVHKIEEMGCNGDMLEAEAFGFLAVRSFYKMPITFPTTTGVERELTGGVFCQA